MTERDKQALGNLELMRQQSKGFTGAEYDMLKADIQHLASRLEALSVSQPKLEEVKSSETSSS